MFYYVEISQKKEMLIQNPKQLANRISKLLEPEFEKSEIHYLKSEFNWTYAVGLGLIPKIARRIKTPQYTKNLILQMLQKEENIQIKIYKTELLTPLTI